MRINYFRIVLIYCGLLALAGLLVGRLYWLQVIEGQKYAIKAERQYTKPSTNIFNRGAVFFQTKDSTLISAATLKSGFTVVVNPSKISNPEAVYEKLAPILLIERVDFLTKISNKKDVYREIVKRVDVTKAEAISALKITGVSILKENWRLYPAGSLAAHALGLVGYKGNEFAGRYGLERFYEGTLKRDPEALFANFFAETFSNVKKTVGGESSEGDVVTTIEPTVEDFLEKVLASTTDRYKSKKTGGIIINPTTGEIYAMGVYPTFDPNNPQVEKNVSIFSNPLVENVYEMGSIIKPLTVSAGLDVGVITPKTTYFDQGWLTLNKATISNYDHKGRGVVTMQQVLNQSLNTGVAFVVKAMGKERFAQYMLNFGLGEKTGIDLPNESSGLVTNLRSPRDLEYATASFGQGIAMSPMATTRALSALANGGKLVTPHLAKKINYSIGLSKTLTYPEGAQVIKKETADTITKMLVTVVDEALANGKVKNPRYSVAAKTGTAQISNPAGGYYTDRYLHSFFGYFPASAPKFLVFLYTVEPQGVQYASETLTPSFMELSKFLLNYYEVPPDR
ncbi:MAG: penicillin-binding protein 2 [Candidatus Paceibacterota bacterium]|jgi:cell division protein FtsI/penicillin-binding protein 2